MATKKLSNVSFVMPVLNEEKYLASAVESVLSQELSGKSELVLALGPSSDATDVIAQDLAKNYPKRIQLVENPSGSTATGLNLAIEKSKYEVVIRVDAHSELGDSYAATAVAVLNETGAANVGGMMIAKGRTEFQSAVAYGYNNRIGLGGGAFHVGGAPGPADTVYLGCFRKSVLEELGGFSAKWKRGQDWELNKRIRQAGHTVWFDPRLKVTYFPRSSWEALAKQFFETGAWRGALTREAPTEAAFRYWIPPLLVAGSLLAWPLSLYLLGIAIAAFLAKDLSKGSKWWLLVVLPTMHFAWGIGFWRGLFVPPRAQQS